MLCVISIGFFAAAWTLEGKLPLWGLMAWGGLTFFCLGLLFGNFNAMAMEPLGHIAGVGAAVIGSLTGIISLILGTTIGQAYDGTVLPLIGGFAGWARYRWRSCRGRSGIGRNRRRRGVLIRPRAAP